MTQFRCKSSGPLGPEGYRAAARKLRHFAERLDARAEGAPSALTPLLRDIEAHARSLAIRHQKALVPQSIHSDGSIEVRADFAQASSPLMFRVAGDDDDAWRPTPYQVADARHDASRALALVSEWAEMQS